MFVGFPAKERTIIAPDELSFGIYSGMQGATGITNHQITLRFTRDLWLSHMGHNAPPLGYGLGGISGGPLLVPD